MTAPSFHNFWHGLLAARYVVLVLALSSVGSGCAEQLCLQAVLPSVRATVVDAASQQNLGAVASGTIVQGSLSLPFTRAGDELIAGENRAGAFSVTIQAPGYRAWQGQVTVEPYNCIVVTQELRVELERETD